MTHGKSQISARLSRLIGGGGSERNKVLNIEMIRAGTRAFRAWDPRALEAERMVCEVFFAMLGECNKIEMTQFLANRFFKSY